MTLIVETGAGIEGANTFVSLEDAQAFITARGYSVVLTEGLLLRAMDALGGVGFDGTALTALPWPRSGVDGVEEDSVPANIGTAQIWLSYHIANGDDPLAVSGPAIKREKVDVIETEFAVSDGDSSTVSALDLPPVGTLLALYLSADASASSAFAGSIARA